MTENSPFIVDRLDKRVTDRFLREGSMDRREYVEALKALPDIAAKSDRLTLVQDDELERRAQRRRRLQENRRVQRSLSEDEFTPAAPTPKAIIIDEE